MDINLGLSVTATGTVDAITCTASPVPASLTDGLKYFVRTLGTNTSTTPTVSPNGLTARTIVKGGFPLLVGDIPAVAIIQYDLANTRWELLNPVALTGLGYTLTAPLAIVAVSPADSTSYYWGGSVTNAAVPTANTRRLYIPKAGTIKAAYITTIQTAGSAETSSAYIRLNNTTDTLISSAIVNNVTNIMAVFSNTAMSVAVVAGDYIEFKWATAAWVTNPTAVHVQAVIYIE